MFECYECGEQFARYGKCPYCGGSEVGPALGAEEDDEENEGVDVPDEAEEADDDEPISRGRRRHFDDE